MYNKGNKGKTKGELTMKNVMTIAWEIARKGAAKFGGKVKSYFAQALKMAWAQVKAPAAVVMELRSGSRNHKTWVAEIVAVGGKFGFERKFIDTPYHPEFGAIKVAELEEGKFYDVCNGGDRDFVTVTNGQITYVNKQDVQAAF